MTNPEQSTTDNSLAAITARLKSLQPSLKNLMGSALDLFDDYYLLAPHPAEVPGSPVYATKSMNICPVERIPMGREFTVVLGSGRWIRVFRNTESSPPAYPRQRLWYWQPSGENRRQVNVLRTHSPRRVDTPYDIETSDFNAKGLCVGLVGGVYEDQEQYIELAQKALSEAREVAEETLGVKRDGALSRLLYQPEPDDPNIFHNDASSTQGYVIPQE